MHPIPEQDNPSYTGSWLICTACGTQFPTDDKQQVKTCFICDDPRQFTPPTGQSFTTLDELCSNHKNTWTPFSGDDDFISIVTKPKVGIGQRAILIKTPKGNVLWDCITLLDDETVENIKGMGGLKAIVISHPHYYSTHADWGRAFNCPVYLAAEDKQWTTQTSPQQVFVTETEMDINIDGEASGVKVLKLGGHFPGSFVTLYNGRLLIADTLLTTPAGLGSWDADALGNARSRPKGMNSFSFMWSIPNFIPLAPDELERMWAIIKKYEFRSTHGAFLKTDIVKTEAEMKQRVLDSMQIQIKYMGYGNHSMLKETAD
ncbi:metallo-beta-lactamase family protein [Pseudomassariella vexata]|uniref:Metallo-beta-lactamase family protein n=1 Tax=Pseudomassariella vexata TaxID=1141098 RepID=A0A1Y2EAI4_9PEZI|nr:metallo-beta-lactamase family protein [Pseudomassariella vexata]ORY68600.1 metallo-beta-lactamase family protein [Pseudomassariella vexata]